MSVRNGLLAILADRSAHGYGLKSRFEQTTAGAWPLNVGQVYTTLGRLQRDGLVESTAGATSDQQAWRITRAGRSALEEWFRTPVDAAAARDELAIKVLLAIASHSPHVDDILQRQRVHAMERLQAYTRSKREASPVTDLPWLLWLDALIFKAEAEIKWLDACELRLRGRTP